MDEENILIIETEIDNDITSVINSEIEEIDSLTNSLNESGSNQPNEDKKVITINEIDIPQAIEEFVNLLEIKNKKEIIKYTLGLYEKSKL